MISNVNYEVKVTNYISSMIGKIWEKYQSHNTNSEILPLALRTNTKFCSLIGHLTKFNAQSIAAWQSLNEVKKYSHILATMEKLFYFLNYYTMIRCIPIDAVATSNSRKFFLFSKNNTNIIGFYS